MGVIPSFIQAPGKGNPEDGRHYRGPGHDPCGPITVDPETTVEEIATLMVKKNIHTLPVVDKGKLVGVVGKEGILRTLMPGRE